MITFDDIDDIITLQFHCTLKCNFQCGHCGESAGPDVRSGYISDSKLSQINDVARVLRDSHKSVEVNLVGGEPTLNLSEFSRILEHVSRWGFNITMTTNGWWLDDTRKFLKFLDIVRPYVDNRGEASGGLAVRISGDEHHRQFHNHSGIRRLDYLDDFWDYWWEEFSEEEGDRLYCRLPVAPAQGDPWIYVDDQGERGSHYSYSTIVPIGRGANWDGIGEQCTENKRYVITYDPNGHISDCCCKFSKMPFGTVKDHPLLILNLVDVFMRDRHPKCYNCREDAADWANNCLKAERRRLIAELGDQLEGWYD